MKKILILGATSAIAEQCARIWAVQGHSLFLVARNNKLLDDMASDLKIRGASEVYPYNLDLNQIEKHEELLLTMKKRVGGLDIALIAHGTLPNQKECELSMDLTFEEIKTNALSTISLLTLIANELEFRRSGTIVVISSVAGEKGRASNYVYGSAKAMVSTFASGLRQRLYKSNVAVVTIKPGFVDTPMTKSFEKGIFWVGPRYVAKKIVRASNNKSREIYIPFYWKIVVQVIKFLPISIFKRLKF